MRLTFIFDKETLHLYEVEQDPKVLAPATNHVLCMPFAYGKLWSKNTFNQRSGNCGKQWKTVKRD